MKVNFLFKNERRSIILVCFIILSCLIAILAVNKIYLAQKYDVRMFGFTETRELSAAGVVVKVPPAMNFYILQKNVVIGELTYDDSITFDVRTVGEENLKQWFTRNYPFASSHIITDFRGFNHEGYLIFAQTQGVNNWPGDYFYLTKIRSDKVLIVRGFNNVQSTRGTFFGGNLEKFKSFIYSMKRISLKEPVLEKMGQTYRWSNEKKVIWENSDLELKIIAPEWTETRISNDYDLKGKMRYSGWERVVTKANQYDYEGLDEKRRVEIIGGTYPPYYLQILNTKYNYLSFASLIDKLLIPAGFCSGEWKKSLEKCQGFCYTREDVVNHLYSKKEIELGKLHAELRSIDPDFSGKYDCRGEDTWVIKAKNGIYVLTNIPLDGGPFLVKSF